MYENWVDYVKQTVPGEKLLIFNVKDGIEPLAKFCERDVPSWSMPNVNDSGNLVDRFSNENLFIGKFP